MSFRTELKIPVTAFQAQLALASLSERGLKKIYPDRKICSTYFDSGDNGAFRDSEEGLLPRKKVRIRKYLGTSKDLLLEKKITSIEGRYKTTQMLCLDDEKRYLNGGIFDNDYGEMFPRVVVEYSRSYFQVEALRLTLDREIVYRSCMTKEHHIEKFHVIEIKAPIDTNLDFVDEVIPYPLRRFSKFSNAMSFFFYAIV